MARPVAPPADSAPPRPGPDGAAPADPVWFTADLHLGHANIIGYCARPYPDVERMNQGLVDLWNSQVSPADTVWILGDVAMGRIADSLGWVRRLHGRLVLVTGNHDRCWPGHGGDTATWVQRYRDAGVAEVRHGVVEVTLRPSVGPPVEVLACHFPYEGDSQDADRYPNARPVDDGRWLLHGHVHEVWRQHGRMVNVGVDAWGGRPVHVDELVALVTSGEAELPPLPWHAGPGRPDAPHQGRS